MSGRKRYERAISSLAERKENKPLVFSGILGVTTNGENQVDVPGRNSFVWVRLRNQLNELVQAFNDTVSTVFDLPVLVEWDRLSPTRYRIIGRDVGRYLDWGSSSSYMPVHGAQHSFNPAIGQTGGDIVWVYSQQFMPLLITPSGSAGAMSVSAQPAPYYYDNQFRWAGGTGIAGFDDMRPTGSSNARMLLVYLDPDSGNILIATGSMTEFANTITGTAQILPFVPSLLEPTDVPLAGVRLLTGTSSLLWTNVYDLRDFLVHSSVSGSSGGEGGAPTDAQYVTMALDGDLSAERVLTEGADIDVADGGANGNVTISVETGTFARIPHTHSASQISDVYAHDVAIYEDHVFQATGTIIDFTGNMDVAVSGSSVFVSSTGGGGGGGNTILIYDDGVFKVTGTSVDFEDDLIVVVTGSVAFINIPTGTFSRPGHTHHEADVVDLEHAIPIFEDGVFKVTGTIIDFGENVNVVVSGSVAFVSTIDTQGGGGGGDLLIYDDNVFVATGSAISFDNNLNISVSGSVVYVESPVTTYQRVGEATPLNGLVGATWSVPDLVFASGSLSVFVDGLAQRPGTDYEEMFWVSGTFRYLAAPETGTVHVVMYGVPCVTQIQPGTGIVADEFFLLDSDSELLLDSDSEQLLDSDG